MDKRGCYTGPEQMFFHPLPAPSRLSQHSLLAIPPLPQGDLICMVAITRELPNQLKNK